MKLNRLLAAAIMLLVLAAIAACAAPADDSTETSTGAPAQAVTTMSLPEIPPPGTEPPDAAADETRATAKVTASTITEEDLARLADSVLNSILKPGMTDRDKAYAIHQWIKQNIRYVGRAETEERIEGAYNGLALRSGACYTYYAVARYLLLRAGIDNFIDMEREPGYDDTHYWLLLNLGEGWYHYDACRLRNKNQPHDGFMMTDSEAQNYAEEDNRPEFYRYNKELLPEGVEIVP